MFKFPDASDILWSPERDEAIFTIELDGHPIQCRVTLEAIEEYAGGATVYDGLTAAHEYLPKIEEDVGFLVTAGRFESNGTVLLRASDVQWMRPR